MALITLYLASRFLHALNTNRRGEAVVIAAIGAGIIGWQRKRQRRFERRIVSP